MSTLTRCDLCAEEIANETHALLHVFNFNDGYNTDSYNSQLDICQDCLMKYVGEENIAKGRVF